MFKYAIFRTGPLTIGAGQVGVFTSSNLENSNRPDIQFHFMPFSTDLPGKKLHKFSGITSTICQLRPNSKGAVNIRSNDPNAMPLIIPNYLSVKEDQKITVQGLKIGRKIINSPAISQFIFNEIEPGKNLVTDEDLLYFAKEKGSTIFHPCGTCKMGTDYTSVVNSDLKVIGLTGLRVVDASIMPTIISGNINAATIMIAEKASDLILQDNTTN
jgi:choline dehydrogenase